MIIFNLIYFLYFLLLANSFSITTITPLNNITEEDYFNQEDDLQSIKDNKNEMISMIQDQIINFQST